jgi:hypothetical protein
LDTARQTDERLRSALNGNQPSRERMCLAVLALDRNYTNVQPRRPEGGPDGGRDIQCLRNSQLCFGAVGFVNNACDSPQDKRCIKKKFKDDLQAALKAETKLHAFVFFTNVDLTPGEQKELSEWGRKRGVTFIDIFYRERIRHLLDSPEGLGFRYQYLSMPLSEAEQASFFSRYGSDLERLVKGGFDTVERKVDQLEFNLWKSGTLRKIKLELGLREWEESRREIPEHFRVVLELQSVVHEKRSIMLGGRDDFWETGNGGWFFGTKTLFWRQAFPQDKPLWRPQKGARVGGGIITALRFGVSWYPRSPVLITEFEHLNFHLHVTENLTDRLASARLTLDSYVVFDHKIESAFWEKARPNFDWPDELRPEETKLEWRWCNSICAGLQLEHVPPKTSWIES